VVTEPLLGINDDTHKVKGVSRVIVGCLEVGGEGLGQVSPGVDAASEKVVEPKRRGVTHHQQEVSHHVVEAATSHLDRDVVGRQLDVGVGAPVVLLGVCEVVRVDH
jgi:hypothetical protein